MIMDDKTYTPCYYMVDLGGFGNYFGRQKLRWTIRESETPGRKLGSMKNVLETLKYIIMLHSFNVIKSAYIYIIK